MSAAANETVEDPIIDDGEEDSKEILLMKQRVAEMEKEAVKLRELQAAAALESNTADGEDTNMETEEDKSGADGRSVYVGNVGYRFAVLLASNQVDYGATPEEIQGHFQACGTINRVTILCDKFTGHPKGFAYVEFAEPEHIDAALTMDNSLFRGRLIKDSIVDGDVAVIEVAIEAVTVAVMAVIVHIEAGVAGAEVAGSEILFLQTLVLVLYLFPQKPPKYSYSYMSLSTAAKTYPFSKTAAILPEPYVAPSDALKLGKGLMPHLAKTLPTPEKQQMLRQLFSRQSRNQLYPGSIITVTVDHAPTTFTGVLLAIRRRGPDTSFVVRNIIQRTGVEMQFFVNSPHLKQIKLLQKPPKRRMRRAKLFYLRDSPEKMSSLAGNKKYQ
ncbi:Polyadenylate-binding protein 2 [Favolaschia claudopus]|uniref:Polyadenylate-binding protein 2 n=1 Tax=Favolaschia claudopus TaxID=2862362 RepID=A0AAW0EAR7_9AGAR